MLYAQTPPTEKRRLFRQRLASGEILRFPGAFNPLSARLIEQKGFDGVYISGAVLSADLGLPDIGLTTLTEVAGRGRQIARMTELPAIIDADTGFGEPMNVARTVQEMEDAGLAGLHIEDQVNPKRCGHLDGKQVVDESTALQRIRAAVDARRDPNFLIMARTDIRAVEGLPAAIDRAKKLVDAGADAIFPEAMALARGVRRDPRRRRRAAARQHDRVRQERALHGAAAGGCRHEPRDLAGVAAAPRDGRRGARTRRARGIRVARTRCSARCSTAPTSTSSSTTRATTTSTRASSTSASPADLRPRPAAGFVYSVWTCFGASPTPRAPKIVQSTSR